MILSAHVSNTPQKHSVTVKTGQNSQTLSIAPKTAGRGSSVNGGELLFLALATCYCNDLYREAAQQKIEIIAVTVEVSGEFGGPGEPARNISYRASVEARAPQHEILALMEHTDRVAEIHNTLRRGLPVTLTSCEAIEVP